jgi:glutathione peroxidase
MAIYDHTVRTLSGEDTDLEQYRDKVVLIVNVASKCGFTPQYDGLQALYEKYADRGLAILGFPCNQFGGQEPGAHDEIAEFCRVNFGVSFPLFEKVEVNGEDEHPLFTELKRAPDHEGKDGDVYWNFEKFLIAPGGDQVTRFRTIVTPDDEGFVSAIEDALPADR